MIDVSVVVMSRSHTHDLPAAKEPGRWRQGEPVDVFPYRAGGVHAGTPSCFACINVMSCPGDDIKDVKEWFLTPHNAPDVVGKDGLESGPMLARRKRPVDFSLLTKAEWVQLFDTGLLEITFTDLTGPGDLVIGVGAKMKERATLEKPTTKDETDRKMLPEDRAK